MTFKLAIIGRKGGVGKTTSAVHLAAHFGGLGRRTLLVDGDSREYATTWAKGADMPFDVEGTGGLVNAYQYDALVIDSEADPKESDIATLGKHSDLVLLPTVPEAQAISGLIQTVQVLDRTGVNRSMMRVLLTMDTRAGTATAEAREVLEAQGLNVLARTIRDTVAFRHASGQSRLVHQVRSPAGRMAWEDYRAVAVALLADG